MEIHVAAAAAAGRRPRAGTDCRESVGLDAGAEAVRLAPAEGRREIRCRRYGYGAVVAHLLSSFRCATAATGDLSEPRSPLVTVGPCGDGGNDGSASLLP